MPGENVSDPTAEVDVSPNNPCPFLRALVAERMLSRSVASIDEVTETVVRVAKAGDGNPHLSPITVRAVAMIAHGLSLRKVLRNRIASVQLSALRKGPLDKQGAGSRILTAAGEIDEAELDRLDTFATDKVGLDGESERGLGTAELTSMMDANFERAKGRRRRIDRRLMEAEWPVLLRVMGKHGKYERYLSVDDVRRLYRERRLPQRMSARLRRG